MPFLGFDPRYTRDERSIAVPDRVVIPAEDAAAYDYYRRLGGPVWVYNKLRLCAVQGVEAAPCPVPPAVYPAVVKPVTNLDGGSTGLSVCRNRAEYTPAIRAGYFWMPHVAAEHYGVDVAVYKGVPVWTGAVYGHPGRVPGTFAYWQTAHHPLIATAVAARFAAHHLHSYTGLACFEVRGTTIIDAHLRPGDCTTVGGAPVIKSVVSLYGGNGWRYDKPLPEGYILPLFTRYYPSNVPHDLAAHLSDAPGVTAVRIDEQPDTRHSRPPGAVRVLTVAGTDYKAAAAARRTMAQAMGVTPV